MLRKIITETALTYNYTDTSFRSQVLNISDFILKSGGIIDSFVLSQSSANRARNQAVIKMADEIKRSFKAKLAATGKVFVLHFNTVSLTSWRGKSAQGRG